MPLVNFSNFDFDQVKTTLKIILNPTRILRIMTSRDLIFQQF